MAVTLAGDRSDARPQDGTVSAVSLEWLATAATAALLIHGLLAGWTWRWMTLLVAASLMMLVGFAWGRDMVTLALSGLGAMALLLGWPLAAVLEWAADKWSEGATSEGFVRWIDRAASALATSLLGMETVCLALKPQQGALAGALAFGLVVWPLLAALLTVHRAVAVRRRANQL